MKDDPNTDLHEGERMRIVLVDFDAVVHLYRDGWKGPTNIYDEPVPGAFEFLADMVAHPQLDPQIYSARSRHEGGIDAMQRWMTEKGCPSDVVCALAFPTEKPAAWLTIDDRAFCFQGKFPTAEFLLHYQPWNKTPFRVDAAAGLDESDADFLRGIVVLGEDGGWWSSPEYAERLLRIAGELDGSYVPPDGETE